MRNLAFIAIFFIMLPWAFIMPHLGVLIWSWMAFGNPHREVYGFARSMPYNLIIAAVTLGAWALSTEAKRIPLVTTTVLIMLFGFWMTLSSYMAFDPSYAWPLWERHIKTLLLALVVMGLMQKRTRVHALVWVIVISLGYWGVKSGIFFLGTAGQYRIWGPELSMIADNNHLAVALLMSVPLMYYLRMHSENIWVQRGLLVGIVLTLLSVIGTQSRGGFIALLAMALMYWWRSKKKAGAAIVFVILGLSASFVVTDQWVERIETIENYDDDDSFQSRVDAWVTAYNIAKDRPLIGGGFAVTEIPVIYFRYNEGIDEEQWPRAAHSAYFQVLGDQGFAGLAIYLMLGFVAWLNTRYVISETRGRVEYQWAHDLANMIQVSLVAFFVGSAALSFAYYDVYYVLLAVTAVLKLIVVRELQPSILRTPRLSPMGPHPARQNVYRDTHVI